MSQKNLGAFDGIFIDKWWNFQVAILDDRRTSSQIRRSNMPTPAVETVLAHLRLRLRGGVKSMVKSTIL